jgi:hypothetical protein
MKQSPTDTSPPPSLHYAFTYPYYKRNKQNHHNLNFKVEQRFSGHHTFYDTMVRKTDRKSMKDVNAPGVGGNVRIRSGKGASHNDSVPVGRYFFLWGCRIKSRTPIHLVCWQSNLCDFWKCLETNILPLTFNVTWAHSLARGISKPVPLDESFRSNCMSTRFKITISTYFFPL